MKNDNEKLKVRPNDALDLNVIFTFSFLLFNLIVCSV